MNSVPVPDNRRSQLVSQPMVVLAFTQVIIMRKYTPGSRAIKGCNQPNFEVGCGAGREVRITRRVEDEAIQLDRGWEACIAVQASVI